MEDEYIRGLVKESINEIKHILDLFKDVNYEIIRNEDTAYLFTLFSGAIKSSSAELLTAMAHFTKFTEYNGDGK